MLSLKFLMKCCCDNTASQEEEKLPKPYTSKTEPRASTITHSFPNTEGKISEEPTTSFPIQSKDPSFYPKLHLTITESSVIPLGTVLTITSKGLENSKRNKSDHKTYIGSQLSEKGEIINDFVIEEESQGMGKQHFLIKFNSTLNKYLISDLGDGTGTFVKICSELLLKNGFIISFGNSHMKVSTGLADKLGIKFLEGPKTHEEYFFSQSDETVLIGRMTDCRIKFDDSNMSRYQCSVAFQQGRGWVLRDGINGKGSTNGTWLYVEEEFEIVDKMLFKAGKTLFEVSLE